MPDATRENVEGRVESRREEILEAATRLFAALGYDNADTQRLADNLDVGKGTLYRYFPSKRELFLAAVDRAMGALYERIESDLQGIDEPFDRMACAIEAFLGHAEDHPELVELLIQERARFKDRVEPTYFEYRRRSVARWRELYRSLMEAGRLRPMPLDRITGVVSAALYGILFLGYFGGRAEAHIASAEDVMDILLFGILSETERCRFPAATETTRPAPD